MLTQNWTGLTKEANYSRFYYWHVDKLTIRKSFVFPNPATLLNDPFFAFPRHPSTEEYHMKIGKWTVRDSLVALKLSQCPQQFIKNKPLLLTLTLPNKIPEEIFAYFRLMRIL